MAGKVDAQTYTEDFGRCDAATQGEDVQFFPRTLHWIAKRKASTKMYEKSTRKPKIEKEKLKRKKTQTKPTNTWDEWTQYDLGDLEDRPPMKIIVRRRARRSRDESKPYDPEMPSTSYDEYEPQMVSLKRRQDELEDKEQQQREATVTKQKQHEEWKLVQNKYETLLDFATQEIEIQVNKKLSEEEELNILQLSVDEEIDQWVRDLVE